MAHRRHAAGGRHGLPRAGRRRDPRCAPEPLDPRRVPRRWRRPRPRTSPLRPHLIEARSRSGPAGNPQFLLDLLVAAAGGRDERPPRQHRGGGDGAAGPPRRPSDRALVRCASVLVAQLPSARARCRVPRRRRPAARRGDLVAAGARSSPTTGTATCASAVACVRDAAYAGPPLLASGAACTHVAGERLERELGAIARRSRRPALAALPVSPATTRAPSATRAPPPTALPSTSRSPAPSHLYRRALDRGAHGSRSCRTGSCRPSGRRSARRYTHTGEPSRRHGGVHRRGGRYAGPTPSVAARLAAPARRTVVARARGSGGARRALVRARVCAMLDGVDRTGGGGVRAPSSSPRSAPLRQRQGRARRRSRLCPARRSTEAEAAGDGRSRWRTRCCVLDWALAYLGTAAATPGHSERALEIYIRLGDADREAAVLNNLGVYRLPGTGRWDEAVSFYARAADASLRAGDVANAAFGDCNLGRGADRPGPSRRRRASCLRRARRRLARDRGRGTASPSRRRCSGASRVRARAGRRRASSCSRTRPRASGLWASTDDAALGRRPDRAEALAFAGRAERGARARAARCCATATATAASARCCTA